MKNSTLKEISNVLDTAKSTLQARIASNVSELGISPESTKNINDIIEAVITDVKHKSLTYLQKLD